MEWNNQNQKSILVFFVISIVKNKLLSSLKCHDKIIGKKLFLLYIIYFILFRVELTVVFFF